MFASQSLSKLTVNTITVIWLVGQSCVVRRLTAIGLKGIKRALLQKLHRSLAIQRFWGSQSVSFRVCLLHQSRSYLEQLNFLAGLDLADASPRTHWAERSCACCGRASDCHRPTATSACVKANTYMYNTLYSVEISVKTILVMRLLYSYKHVCIANQIHIAK
jgi:hypothetical protein